MADKKIVVDFGANFNKFYSEFSQAKKKTEDGLSSLKKSIMSIGAAYAVGNFLKGAVQESIAASKAIAKVEQAVKQTGGAAGLTTNQLKDMASRLEDINAIDGDEILQDSILQLLTFGNIGKENFERASQAAMDLSAVLETDLKSQTIQLGKALHDPVRGLTALRKAGVMFSESQEKQIKNFVEHNDLLSAQGMILTEIESKYGGQAKAQADATQGVQQAMVAWGNLKEEVGNLFGPLLAQWLPEAIKGIKGLQILLAGGKTAKENVQAGTAWDFTGTKKEDREKLIAEWQKNIEMTKKTQKEFYEQRYKKNNYARDFVQEKANNAVIASLERNIQLARDYKEVVVDNSKKVKVFSQEEIDAAKKAAKEKAAALKKYYDEVKFFDDSYWTYRNKTIDDEVAEMKKAGLKNVDYKLFEINKKKEIDKDYIAWLKDLYGSKISFDENGQITSIGAPLETGEMTPGKLKGRSPGPKPGLDLGSPEQIMEEWINGSELASAAYVNFISEAVNLTNELQFKINDTMNFGTRAVLGFANAALSAIEQIIAKWAILNIFSLAGGMGGVNLFSMLGFDKKASGGSVYSNSPYLVGERGPELFMPSQNGYIYPNHSLNNISVKNNFTDKNIMNGLQSIQQSVLYLAKSLQQNGVSRHNDIDIVKTLAKEVTKYQSGFTKGNAKYDRG